MNWTFTSDIDGILGEGDGSDIDPDNSVVVSDTLSVGTHVVTASVTDAGGLLSHSAIVSREYGIPGVVGTRDATQLIPDGAQVRVDGDAGEVTVL